MLQIWLFAWSSTYLEAYLKYIYGALTVLGVIVLIYIINSEGNPAFKMTWMLFVMAFPGFGTLFYIFTKLQPGTHFMRDRQAALKVETDAYMQQDREVVEAIWAEIRQRPVVLLSVRAGIPYLPEYRGDLLPAGRV